MAYYSDTDDISFVPLTPDEEKNLFLTFYAGGADALAARDELIHRHLKLAAKLALTYGKRAMPEDDSISAGNLGLIQALECRKFDPSRGFRFASYVRSYIRGQVFSALRQRGFVVASNEDYALYPDDAAVTGVQGSSGGERPMTYSRDTIDRKHNPEFDTAVDHGYEKQQLNEVRRQRLDEAISSLSKMEQISIRAVELEGKSHADVAREHGVSRQASQQAHSRGMVKLKALMEAHRAELY